MIGNFERSFREVIKSEGGFVNNPADPGGMTNLGVTKANWEAYIGHPVTEADMRALTPATVEPFYKKRYWDVCRCDLLHAGLDYLVFDIAVNSGTGRAAKFLQSAVGVGADGSIGPATLAAVGSTALSTSDLINIICDRRAAFYKGLPTFPTFGKGWLSRCESVRKEALEWANV